MEDPTPVQYTFVLSLCVVVVAAEVVDTSNISDVVFPVRSNQLKNFSLSVEINKIAQITIPATFLTRLATQNNERGEWCLFTHFLP